MSFNERIAEEYGLTIFESEAPDREVIDFSVYDSDRDDNVAWGWGGRPQDRVGGRRRAWLLRGVRKGVRLAL